MPTVINKIPNWQEPIYKINSFKLCDCINKIEKTKINIKPSINTIFKKSECISIIGKKRKIKQSPAGIYKVDIIIIFEDKFNFKKP